MDLYPVNFANIYFLLLPIISGNLQGNFTEFNKVLVLQYNNIEIYIFESFLMRFLNCLSGAGIKPCVVQTQPSMSSEFYLTTTERPLTIDGNITHIHVNCFIHRYRVYSNYSSVNITCEKYELSCDTIINVYTSQPPFLSQTFHISWQHHVTVKLINESLKHISLRSCKESSTKNYVIYVSASVMIAILLLLVVVTTCLNKKKCFRHRAIIDVKYEEIDSSLVCSIPSMDTTSGPFENLDGGKPVCVNENASTSMGHSNHQAVSVHITSVYCKENMYVANENNFKEGDNCKIVYFVLEPEME